MGLAIWLKKGSGEEENAIIGRVLCRTRLR